MPTLSWTILLLTGLGLSGVLAFLYCASKSLHFHLELHDLMVEAHTIRNSQVKRLAELRGSDAWDSAELVIDPLMARAINAAEGGDGELKQAA